MKTGWRNAYRSFYYEDLGDLPDIVLNPKETALLVIDLQCCYLPAEEPKDEIGKREYLRWAPFRKRIRDTVIPSVQSLLTQFRDNGSDVLFARICSLTPEGRDRSLSQARPGFNNINLPFHAPESQILPEIAPLTHEIVLTKTTDSAVTGTNLRLLLTNLKIRNVVCVGVFTDQCVSCTVRSLADESFNVIVVDDACAAGTDELHEHELSIINNIYCQVLSCEETLQALAPAP